MEKKTVITMDYDEVDKLINEHWHTKDFSVVADQEADNDSALRFVVNPRELSYYNKKDIDWGIWPNYVAGSLLDHLCWVALIEPGEYIIYVSW